MKHSSMVLDAFKDMRQELRQSHHTKSECETIPSQLSNWYQILVKVDSVYDENSENNFSQDGHSEGQKWYGHNRSRRY